MTVSVEWRAMIWRPSWNAPLRFLTRGPADCVDISRSSRRPRFVGDENRLTWIEGEESAFRLREPPVRRVLDALRGVRSALSGVRSAEFRLKMATEELGAARNALEAP